MADVGAVDYGDKLARLLRSQPFDNLGARVFRSEVVAPLQNSVSIVDEEEGDTDIFYKLSSKFMKLSVIRRSGATQSKSSFLLSKRAFTSSEASVFLELGKTAYTPSKRNAST